MSTEHRIAIGVEQFDIFSVRKSTLLWIGDISILSQYRTKVHGY